MVRGGQRAVGSLESRKFMVYEWLSCVLPCLCVALWLRSECEHADGRTSSGGKNFNNTLARGPSGPTLVL